MMHYAAVAKWNPLLVSASVSLPARLSPDSPLEKFHFVVDHY